ncbi:MAG: hypothetical protein J6Y78_08515 [Paludibacteraceae bacterium]|nr:hypothetical protein [Paludibacteraceae bacterium]
MTLGEIISQYTKNHSMKDFLYESGLSKSYVYMLIHNKNTNGLPITPSLDTIKKVAAGMHTSFDNVFEQLDDDITVHLGNCSAMPDDLMLIYKMLPIKSKEVIHEKIREEYEKNKSIITEYYRIKNLDKITEVEDAKFLVDYAVFFGDNDADAIMIETANSIKNKPNKPNKP